MGYHVFVSRVPPQANAQNAFKEWHVAFHGTAPQNVRKILDTGGLVVHSECESCKLMYYLYYSCTQGLWQVIQLQIK